MKYLFFLLIFSFAHAIDPINQVIEWFHDENGNKHTLACLCTVTADHKPNGRIIDIVHWDEKGALFFTHLNTEKVKELALNPYASLNSWLPQTKRQITIRGATHLITREECLPYWELFPRHMQIKFLHQTDVVYPEKISMPDEFIGYRLLPEEILFFEIVESFPKKRIFKRDSAGWILCD